MTDKLEEELAEGMGGDLGIKAMAAKLAPRPDKVDFSHRSSISPSLAQGSFGPATIEAKLQDIERLIRDIRQISTNVKGLLG